MPDGAGSSALLSRIARTGSNEVHHPVDAFYFKGVQVVVRHAVRLSHENHVDYLILALKSSDISYEESTHRVQLQLVRKSSTHTVGIS